MNGYLCYVCQRAISRLAQPHTFHAEGCPWRNPDGDGDPNRPCEGLDGCGEDVHAACCPTCNWDPEAVTP